jgi:hypothetical protein
MNKIRPATPEEIADIATHADLSTGGFVVAMENTLGPTDLAVVRQVWEIDPLFNRSGSNTRKAAFYWNLETSLRLQGVPAYYFNVGAGDDQSQWRKVLDTWGATPTSQEPEFRYKKVL